MITIALIKKNLVEFDRIEEFASPLLYRLLTAENKTDIKNKLNNYLWSVVSPYVTFIETDAEDLLSSACYHISECFPDKNPDDFFYHTVDSYSFPKNNIELIYGQPNWNGYVESENMNNLGCLFSLNHTVIENNCILISNKYDIKSTHFAKLSSITKDDILKVIRRRFFHTACVIRENSVEKYYYQSQAILASVIFGLSASDSIQKLSFTLFGYNLSFCFLQSKTKYVNQIATRINGVSRVYGDILVIHEIEENIPANLSVHEMRRLNVLAYGRLYDRQKTIISADTTTTNTEPTKEITEQKQTPLQNRYINVEEKMASWQTTKNRCIMCNKSALQTCPQCYRIKYCSDTCKEDYRSHHNGDCINE